MNKKRLRNIGTRARFVPFWIMLAVLGILLAGSFITPIRIVLDDAFDRIESSAIDNNTPLLSCTNSNASGIMKATCWSLGGFMVVFILYLLYQWITAMINGAKAKGPVFAPRLRRVQQALQQ